MSRTPQDRLADIVEAAARVSRAVDVLEYDPHVGPPLTSHRDKGNSNCAQPRSPQPSSFPRAES